MLITSVAATPPTVVVNGVTKSTYGPVWADTTKDLPCAVWQILNSDGSQCEVQPTDTVTATIPFATITTAGYGPNGPVTNGTIGNYVGRYEPGLNGCPDDTPRPTMGIGYCSAGNFNNDAPINPSRNARLRFPQINGSTVYDLTTNTPLYFPAGTTVFGIIADVGNNNLIDGLAMPVATGVYSVVFQDTNALDPVNYLQGLAQRFCERMRRSRHLGTAQAPASGRRTYEALPPTASRSRCRIGSRTPAIPIMRTGITSACTFT